MVWDRLVENGFLLVTDGTCHVSGVVKYSNGTQVITVKGVQE